MAAEETPKESPKLSAEDTTDMSEESVLMPEHEPGKEHNPEPEISTKPPHKLKRLWLAAKHNKKVSIPLAVLLLVGVLLAVPFTRYALLGPIVKRDFGVVVQDKTTSKPISNALVTIDGKTVQTDNKGAAHLQIGVGNHTLTAQKKYYKTATQKVLVPLATQKTATTVALEATGRQVPITVTNKISGHPVENALVKALDTEAKTDKDGRAVMVLPADKSTVEATVTATDYNSATLSIQVTEQEVKQNSLALVPADRVYFLSKQSGKIDVVKTDLAGGNRQVVVAGTGKEDEQDTILLATRDWKYLALKSKRSGGENAKLFVIDTTTDKLTVMDEGNASFNTIGWDDHYFVYTVDRTAVNAWQPKKSALKSYNAETGKLTTIDETAAEGTSDLDYASENIGDTYIVDRGIIYVKNWSANYLNINRLGSKQAKIILVQPDGTKSSVLKSLSVPNGISTSAISFSGRSYEAQGIYYQFSPSPDFYKYENGQVTPTKDVTQNSFYQTAYPTYLVSPSGKQTFWAEARDGKNTLFIGDINGKGGKQIASLSEYTPYGWYGDGYVLVSKKGSELYIMPVSGGTTVIKVGDYHKPAASFSGYGYGYGGI